MREGIEIDRKIDNTLGRLTWRQCVTLFTEELPWLHRTDLDLVTRSATGSAG